LEPRLHRFEHDFMTVLSDDELDELLRMVAVLEERLGAVSLA
jgi:hypothetical protein